MIRYLLTLWESKKKTIIFVTHEIDEALLLGDRILFLTNRPTKVLTEFRIETPKMQRSLTDLSLVKVRNKILDLLQNENQRVDS